MADLPVLGEPVEHVYEADDAFDCRGFERQLVGKLLQAFYRDHGATSGEPPSNEGWSNSLGSTTFHSGCASPAWGVVPSTALGEDGADRFKSFSIASSTKRSWRRLPSQQPRVPASDRFARAPVIAASVVTSSARTVC